VNQYYDWAYCQRPQHLWGGGYPRHRTLGDEILRRSRHAEQDRQNWPHLSHKSQPGLRPGLLANSAKRLTSSVAVPESVPLCW